MEKVICYIRGREGKPYVSYFGVVLAVGGSAAEHEMVAIDADLYGWHFEPPTDMTGLVVFEGECVNTVDEDDGWEPEFRGSWRRPTADELSMLCRDVPVAVTKRSFK